MTAFKEWAGFHSFEGSAYALFSLKSLCKKRYLVVEADTRMFNEALSEFWLSKIRLKYSNVQLVNFASSWGKSISVLIQKRKYYVYVNNPLKNFN